METKSGMHIHHLVWGILLLMVMGYLGIATAIPDPWFELVAIGFGIGMGLTLDEFALWLNLEDVYWEKQGRLSIDAVVVTMVLLFVTLLGLRFWIDVYDAVLVLTGAPRGNEWVAIPDPAGGGGPGRGLLQTRAQDGGPRGGVHPAGGPDRGGRA